MHYQTMKLIWLWLSLSNGDHIVERCVMWGGVTFADIPKHSSVVKLVLFLITIDFQCNFAFILRMECIAPVNSEHEKSIGSPIYRVIWSKNAIRKVHTDNQRKNAPNDFNKFVYGMKLLVAWQVTSNQISYPYPYPCRESVKTKGMHFSITFVSAINLRVKP